MQEDCLKKERKKRFMATRIENKLVNPLHIHDYKNKLYKHTCNRNFKSMERWHVKTIQQTQELSQENTE